MNASSASPSLLRSLWSLIAFILFPILAFIWMEKCEKQRNSHSATFSFLAVLGFITLMIAGVETAHILRNEGNRGLLMLCLVAYSALAYLNLLLIARVQSQFRLSAIR